MSDVHDYEVELEWETARKGVLSSPVLNDTVEVATPPEFTGGMEGIWSPEHLYVASVSSCLMTTFLAIAEFSKLEYISLSVRATGRLEKVDGRFMMSEITLYPVLSIPEDTDPAKADRILHKAEAACLISNSIKTRVIMETEIKVLDSGVIL